MPARNAHTQSSPEIRRDNTADGNVSPQDSLLNVLERLLTSQDPADRTVAEVIHVMVRHLRFIPIETDERDLEVLLSLSIAMARARRLTESNAVHGSTDTCQKPFDNNLASQG